MTNSQLSPREIGVLVFSLFLVGLCFGGSSPLVAAILEERGFPEYFTGTVTAILSLGLAITSPWFGKWVSRLGPRPVNAAGILGQGFGFLMIAASLLSHEYFLLPARLWLGVAAAATFVAAEYALILGSPPKYRARVLSFYGASFSSGFTLGIFASSHFYAWFGIGWFVFLGVGSIIIAPLSWWSMKRTSAELPSTTISRTTINWSPLRLSIHAAVAYAIFDVAMTGTYPIEGQRLGLSSREALNIVAWMALGSVVSQPIAGWLADRYGKLRTLTALSVLAAAAACGAGISASQPIPWMMPMTISFVIVGCAMGGMYPVGLALLGERVSPGDLSQANAAFVAAFGYASFLAPFLGAGLVDLVGRVSLTGWAVPLLAIVTSAALWPLVWMERENPGRRQSLSFKENR